MELFLYINTMKAKKIQFLNHLNDRVNRFKVSIGIKKETFALRLCNVTVPLCSDVTVLLVSVFDIYAN